MTNSLSSEIIAYNNSVPETAAETCNQLAEIIHRELPDATHKIWHRHPVWFLDGNPVAGYSVMKQGIRLLFWSGQSFDEPGLIAEGSFKAAEFRYQNVSDIDESTLVHCLQKCRDIQWDYKNIVKRKGVLERLK